MTDSSGVPVVGAAETVDEIVKTAKRRGPDFRLRLDFVQRREDDAPIPGRLADLVTASDRRGLLLYLLLVTKASAPPFDATLHAAVWARALDLPLPASKSARSTISKTWKRLESLGLISRTRKGRQADVSLLKEDGSGSEYTSPGEVGDVYFRVPLALWTTGPDPSERWYQLLSLPELAVMLIGRSLGDSFLLPQDKGPAWYGISADTVARGLSGLTERDLLVVNETFKPAPLTPTGMTTERRYTLQPPFGPVGRKSGASKKARGVKSPRKKTKSRAGGTTSSTAMKTKTSATRRRSR